MSRSGSKILIVEDEPLLRELAADILTDSGFGLIETGSADEALRVLEQRSDEICLVFTDINMQGSMDGLELSRRIAARWPWIKLLITSGRGKPPRREMPAGATFTMKPWRESELLSRVSEICEPESGPRVSSG